MPHAPVRRPSPRVVTARRKSDDHSVVTRALLGLRREVDCRLCPQRTEVLHRESRVEEAGIDRRDVGEVWEKMYNGLCRYVYECGMNAPPLSVRR
jgi:hypothetical protein